MLNNPPAEVLSISPEALEVANAYLQSQDASLVAAELSIPTHLVASILARREVKAYINQVFYDVGFNNRHRMRSLMDTIIKKKLEDMNEADIGSNKDITEILSLSHKMTMDIMDKEIQLEKLKEANIKSQTNIQINGAPNYSTLIEKLLNDS